LIKQKALDLGTVIPRAYIAIIFSSKPSKRFYPFGYQQGLKASASIPRNLYLIAPSSPATLYLL
jgi:hypothetical protein